MITPLVSKNCMEYMYTLQNKIWVSFQTPRQLRIQLRMNKQGSMLNKSKRINTEGVKPFDELLINK